MSLTTRRILATFTFPSAMFCVVQIAESGTQIPWAISGGMLAAITVNLIMGGRKNEK